MKRYHPFLVVLHWLLALMIIGGLVAGTFILAPTPNSDPFKMISLMMHMTMGISILILMAIRLIVRFATKKPPHADIGNTLLNKGAIAAHWAFYVVVFGMCFSGLAMANMAGLPAIVFGQSGDPLPATFDDLGTRAAHGMLASLLMALILAHVVAGLYHQFVRRDGLFGRMWFGDRGA